MRQLLTILFALCSSSSAFICDCAPSWIQDEIPPSWVHDCPDKSGYPDIPASRAGAGNYVCEQGYENCGYGTDNGRDVV